jgi:hypothetical protein
VEQYPPVQDKAMKARRFGKRLRHLEDSEFIPKEYPAWALENGNLATGLPSSPSKPLSWLISSTRTDSGLIEELPVSQEFQVEQKDELIGSNAFATYIDYSSVYVPRKTFPLHFFDHFQTDCTNLNSSKPDFEVELLIPTKESCWDDLFGVRPPRFTVPLLAESMYVHMTDAKRMATWTPCYVLACDQYQSPKRLLITWDTSIFPDIKHPKFWIQHGRSLKWVERINLCFESESKSKFLARRREALSQKQLYQHRVNQWLNVVAIQYLGTGMPLKLYHRISFAVMESLKIHFPSKRAVMSLDIAQLLTHFNWHWNFAMKLNLWLDSQPNLIDPIRMPFPVVDVVEFDALIKFPIAVLMLCELRESLAVLWQHFRFPEESCSFDSFHAQICNMLLKIKRKLESDWRTLVQQKLINFHCEGKRIKRAHRIAIWILQEKFQELNRIYIEKLEMAFGISSLKSEILLLQDSNILEAYIPKKRIILDAVINVDQQTILLVPNLEQVNAMVHELLNCLGDGFAEFYNQYDLASSGSTLQFERDKAKAEHIKNTIASSYQFFSRHIETLAPHIWVLRPLSTAELSFSNLDHFLDRLKGTEMFLCYYRPIADPIFGLSHEESIRQLRKGTRLWRKSLETMLEERFKSVVSLMTTVENDIVTNLTMPFSLEKNTWSIIFAVIQNQGNLETRLIQNEEVLYRWYEVAGKHSIQGTLDEEEIVEQYWQVLGTRQRLRWEYDIAFDAVRLAGKTGLSRLVIISEYLTSATTDYKADLELIRKESSSESATDVMRRLSTQRERVTKVENMVKEAECIVQDLQKGMLLVKNQITKSIEALKLSETSGELPNDIPLRDLDLGSNYETINSNFKQLAMDFREFEKELEFCIQMWQLIRTISTTMDMWNHRYFYTLPRDQVGPALKKWYSELTLIKKTLEKSKQNAVGTDCQGSFDPSLKMILKAESLVVDFAQEWPILWCLGSQNLQMKHWFQITKKIGITAHDLDILILEQVRELQLDLLLDILNSLPGSELNILNEFALVRTQSLDLQLIKDKSSKSVEITPSSRDAKQGVSLEYDPSGYSVDSKSVEIRCSIKANSLYLEVSGPSSVPSLWVAGKRTATIPFTQIHSIEPNPPEIYRYLTREGEWSSAQIEERKETTTNDAVLGLEESKSEENLQNSLNADTHLPNLIEGAQAVATLSPLVVFGRNSVRRGIWHTKYGNEFYYLTTGLDENSEDPQLELQLMMKTSVGVCIDHNEELPFHKILFTVPKGRLFLGLALIYSTTFHFNNEKYFSNH